MIVYKCKHGGFCFGVQRAVDTVLSLKGDNIYVLGDLIHNEEVIKNLEKKGIKTVYNIDEIPDNSTLVIRTHGESLPVYKEAEKKNLKVIDCTCPFVSNIHKIVSEKYAEGYKIVIIGNASHAEVIGINSRCNDEGFITDDIFDIDEIKADKVCIVVQTTFSQEKFNNILKNIKKDSAKTVVIFKTICYTTNKRQEEAEMISSKVEACIVLGGKNSNNTRMLFDICKKNCPCSFQVSNPDEVDYNLINKYKSVGIVVGASTPQTQSQEVLSKMDITESKEVESSNVTMEDALKEMEKNSKPFRNGQIIKTIVSSATDEGLMLLIPNTKKEILMPKEELIGEYDKEAFAKKVGDEIEVMIIKVNPVALSEKAMLKVKEEQAAIEEIKNGKEFEVKITASNKGGLIGEFLSYQVFVPSSQIRIGFVKDLEKYVGKTLRVKAEKVEGGKRKQIVASQRVILEAEKAEKDAIRAEKEKVFFDSIEEGDIVKGTTQRFAAFGVFVNVNGFDCLAHISDLSWTGCKKCADVLELNKEYEFKILKIDRENKKVSIGYKQLQPKPWELVAEKYHAGDVVKGKVVRIVPFGAFVEVEPRVDGLVHVSQISNEWLENPTSALKVGEEVEAKILEIDTEKEKMTLSIKVLLPEAPKKAKKEDEEVDNKRAKKAKKEDEDDIPTEWKDDNGGASIAELLGK